MGHPHGLEIASNNQSITKMIHTFRKTVDKRHKLLFMQFWVDQNAT